MEKQKIENKLSYKKHNSFVSFKGKNIDIVKSALDRILRVKDNKLGLFSLSLNHQKLLDKAIKDLSNKVKVIEEPTFQLSQTVLAEIASIADKYLLKYIVHRYRYEIFPQTKTLDDFPPCLQIEPSSICNFRCVFCFETDKTFTNKKNGYMGNMSLDLFKKIIDQAQGNIEFITLASRGEPLACKGIIPMLEYTKGKFLYLKLNTNASMLNEEKCHAILSGGVKTVVFSVDAADEKLYSKMRVNGKLKEVIKNIEQFKKIRETQYSKSSIISRISGVKFSKEQNFNDMKNLWSNLVDQVAFVNYNPWENSYVKPSNNIMTPCSELWRRMFVWWDGKTNPCDSDYKSLLSVGNYPNKTLKQLWQSESYKILREKHLTKKRSSIKPCSSCFVV